MLPGRIAPELVVEGMDKMGQLCGEMTQTGVQRPCRGRRRLERAGTPAWERTTYVGPISPANEDPFQSGPAGISWERLERVFELTIAVFSVTFWASRGHPQIFRPGVVRAGMDQSAGRH